MVKIRQTGDSVYGTALRFCRAVACQVAKDEDGFNSITCGNPVSTWGNGGGANVGSVPVGRVESVLEVNLKDKAVVVFHSLLESVNDNITSPMYTNT